VRKEAPLQHTIPSLGLGTRQLAASPRLAWLGLLDGPEKSSSAVISDYVAHIVIPIGHYMWFVVTCNALSSLIVMNTMQSKTLFMR
jgi:hypothetical protein